MPYALPIVAEGTKRRGNVIISPLSTKGEQNERHGGASMVDDFSSRPEFIILRRQMEQKRHPNNSDQNKSFLARTEIEEWHGIIDYHESSGTNT
jgi:hypothetical protein